MIIPLRLRALTVLAVGGLLVAGCSSSDSDPSADPGETHDLSITPSAVSSGSGTTAADVDCQVKGYVPRSAIVLKRSRPVVVYAHRTALPPASSTSSTALELARADLVPLKVHPDDSTVKLTAADRNQVLGSGGGPVKHGTIADSVSAPVRIKNDSKVNWAYFVYRGSYVDSGTWTKKVCGAPYNDGTSVDTITGTYSTVTRIRPVQVARCGVPASHSRIDRYAARRACQDN